MQDLHLPLFYVIFVIAKREPLRSVPVFRIRGIEKMGFSF